MVLIKFDTFLHVFQQEKKCLINTERLKAKGSATCCVTEPFNNAGNFTWNLPV